MERGEEEEEEEEEEGEAEKAKHVGRRETERRLIERREEEGKAYLRSIRSRMEATVGPDPR